MTFILLITVFASIDKWPSNYLISHYSICKSCRSCFPSTSSCFHVKNIYLDQFSFSLLVSLCLIYFDFWNIENVYEYQHIFSSLFMTMAACLPMCSVFFNQWIDMFTRESYCNCFHKIMLFLLKHVFSHLWPLSKEV